MEVPDKVARYSLLTLLALLVLLIIGGAFKKHQYEAELARLRNDVAGKDQTIQVQNGVYTKLSVETNNIKATLDNKDTQVKELLGQLHKTNQDLLDADQLVLRWKNAYEGAANASQTTVPPATPGAKERKRVDFNQTFGTIGVSGYTLTDPAQSWLRVWQLKPLKLTVAVTQDKKGAWHSYATVDDDNTAVDIAVAAVNPYLLESRWYEGIQVNGVMGVGPGLLAGIGLSYKLKQFDVGPAAFVTISDHLSTYYGVTFSWRPFQR